MQQMNYLRAVSVLKKGFIRLNPALNSDADPNYRHVLSARKGFLPRL